MPAVRQKLHLSACADFRDRLSPPRRAQFVLVVIRSELEMPLAGFYSSVAELKEDAEMQLDIAGSNYVVYMFALDDDLRPTEVRRIAYPASD